MKSDLLRHIVRFTKDVTIAVIAAVLFTQFVLQNLQVRGHSMEPTLVDGQMILIDKIYYKFYEPQVNDIVGFEVGAVEEKIVKRIIGVEGDVINYIGGVLYVNDVPFNSMPSGDVQYPFTVPEGQYFVVGDNVNNSIDSRYEIIVTHTGLI